MVKGFCDNCGNQGPIEQGEPPVCRSDNRAELKPEQGVSVACSQWEPFVSNEDIVAVWDEFAAKYGTDPRASTPDGSLIKLEIKELLKHVHDHDAFLDVGCANGYTAIELSRQRYIYATGIDNSPEMVKYAKVLYGQTKDSIKGCLTFMQGDIMRPACLDGADFDVILTKRTVINIMDWEDQQIAVQNVYRLLRDGGVYLMMEATTQGHERISRLRERFKMPRTAIRWHNNYLDENKLLPFLKGTFRSVTVKDFSSTYYFISRFLYPLLLKPFGGEPSYDSWVNKVAAHLPALGSYGMQKIFICEK